MKQPHGFLLFLTSCLCGCGQMYQGYMKRGLSLLLGVFTLIAAAGFLRLGPLAFFAPVIWLYAFFDPYLTSSNPFVGAATAVVDSVAKLVAAGCAPEDAYLFGLSDMDARQMTALLQKRHSVIGWALVIVGMYLLYDTLIRRLGGILWDWLYYFLCYDLPRVVMTVLVIALGLWFIRGPKVRAVPEDDIPPFTPPVSGGAEPSESAPDPEAAEPLETEQSAESENEEDIHGEP